MQSVKGIHLPKAIHRRDAECAERKVLRKVKNNLPQRPLRLGGEISAYSHQRTLSFLAASVMI
jgi:hypothetical protein